MSDADETDHYIDEDEVWEREYEHAVMLTYVASLLLMGIVYTLLHTAAMYLVPGFSLTNILVLMLTIDFGFFAFQRLSARHNPVPDPSPFTVLLITILLSGIALQLFLTVTAEPVPATCFILVYFAFVSLVATLALLLVLFLILL